MNHHQEFRRPVRSDENVYKWSVNTKEIEYESNNQEANKLP